MSRLRRLVLSDRYFFVTCNVRRRVEFLWLGGACRSFEIGVSARGDLLIGV
jgi:hypothetical protein